MEELSSMRRSSPLDQLTTTDSILRMMHLCMTVIEDSSRNARENLKSDMIVLNSKTKASLKNLRDHCLPLDCEWLRPDMDRSEFLKEIGVIPVKSYLVGFCQLAYGLMLNSPNINGLLNEERKPLKTIDAQLQLDSYASILQQIHVLDLQFSGKVAQLSQESSGVPECPMHIKDLKQTFQRLSSPDTFGYFGNMLNLGAVFTHFPYLECLFQNKDNQAVHLNQLAFHPKYDLLIDCLNKAVNETIDWDTYLLQRIPSDVPMSNHSSLFATDESYERLTHKIIFPFGKLVRDITATLMRTNLSLLLGTPTASSKSMDEYVRLSREIAEFLEELTKLAVKYLKTSLYLQELRLPELEDVVPTQYGKYFALSNCLSPFLHLLIMKSDRSQWVDSEKKKSNKTVPLLEQFVVEVVGTLSWWPFLEFDSHFFLLSDENTLGFDFIPLVFAVFQECSWANEVLREIKIPKVCKSTNYTHRKQITAATLKTERVR